MSFYNDLVNTAIFTGNFREGHVEVAGKAVGYYDLLDADYNRYPITIIFSPKDIAWLKNAPLPNSEKIPEIIKVKELTEVSPNFLDNRVSSSIDTSFYRGIAFEKLFISPGISLIRDKVSGENKDKPVIDYWSDQYSLETFRELGIGMVNSFAGGSSLNVFFVTKIASSLVYNQFSFKFLSPEYLQSILISSTKSLMVFSAVYMSGVHHNDNQFIAGVKSGAISSVIGDGVDMAINMFGEDVSTIDSEL